MAHLIPIGNSLGVRIPKAIISQVGFKNDTALEFKVTSEGLLIAPMQKAREGWADAYEKYADNHLLMEDGMVNQFDHEEWEW